MPTAAGSRKGLSLEEKRTRALDYFHETRDVFQLKDLEKALPKNKGITPQTVKEVVQSLVDDRLVNCEKLGISNYYWSFPSAAAKQRQNTLDLLKAKLEGATAQHGKLEEQLAKLHDVQQDTDPTLLANYNAVRSELKQINAELQEYSENDPAVLRQMEKDLVAKKALNEQWTDALCTLEDYCVRQLNIERTQFRSMFSLADSLFE